MFQKRKQVELILATYFNPIYPTNYHFNMPFIEKGYNRAKLKFAIIKSQLSMDKMLKNNRITVY